MVYKTVALPLSYIGGIGSAPRYISVNARTVLYKILQACISARWVGNNYPQVYIARRYIQRVIRRP